MLTQSRQIQGDRSHARPRTIYCLASETNEGTAHRRSGNDEHLRLSVVHIGHDDGLRPEHVGRTDLALDHHRRSLRRLCLVHPARRTRWPGSPRLQARTVGHITSTGRIATSGPTRRASHDWEPSADNDGHHRSYCPDRRRSLVGRKTALTTNMNHNGQPLRATRFFIPSRIFIFSFGIYPKSRKPYQTFRLLYGLFESLFCVGHALVDPPSSKPRQKPS